MAKNTIKMNTNFLDKCKMVKSGLISIEQLFEEFKLKKYIPLKIKNNTLDNLESYMAITYNIGLDDESEINSIMRSLTDTEVNYSTNDILLGYEVTKHIMAFSVYLEQGIIKYTDDVYDLLFEIGAIDFLNSHSNGDFNRFIDFIDKMSGINYISIYENMTNMFNQLPTQSQLESFENTISNLDESKIDKLIEFNKFNDPLTASTVEAMKLQAIEDVMKKDK